MFLLTKKEMFFKSCKCLLQITLPLKDLSVKEILNSICLYIYINIYLYILICMCVYVTGVTEVYHKHETFQENTNVMRLGCYWVMRFDIETYFYKVREWTRLSIILLNAIPFANHLFRLDLTWNVGLSFLTHGGIKKPT